MAAGDSCEWEKKQMDKFGYYVHLVGDDSSTATGFNAHTHGFDVTFGHPDVQLVFPLDKPTCMDIVSQVAQRLKNGERLEAGKVYRGILGNDYDISLIDATESGRHVLRLILPDVKNQLARKKLRGPFAKQFVQ